MKFFIHVGKTKMFYYAIFVRLKLLNEYTLIMLILFRNNLGSFDHYM